jgi:hypothetical protein
MSGSCCSSCHQGRTCESTIQQYETVFSRHGEAAISTHLTEALQGVTLKDAKAGLLAYLHHFTRRLRFERWADSLERLARSGAIVRTPTTAELAAVTAYEEPARQTAEALARVQGARRGAAVDIDWFVSQVVGNYSVPSALHNEIASLISLFERRWRAEAGKYADPSRGVTNATFWKGALPGRPTLFELEVLADHLQGDALPRLTWTGGNRNTKDEIENLVAHALVRDSEYLTLYLQARNEVMLKALGRGQKYTGTGEVFEALLDDVVDGIRRGNPSAPYYVIGEYDQTDPGYQPPKAPKSGPGVVERLGNWIADKAPQVASMRERKQDAQSSADRLRAKAREQAMRERERLKEQQLTPSSPQQLPPVEHLPDVSRPAPAPDPGPPGIMPTPAPQTPAPQTIYTAAQVYDALDLETAQLLAQLSSLLWSACTGQVVLEALDEPAEQAQMDMDLRPISDLVGARDFCAMSQVFYGEAVTRGLLAAA